MAAVRSRWSGPQSHDASGEYRVASTAYVASARRELLAAFS